METSAALHVAVVGGGIVGARATRQLLAPRGVDPDSWTPHVGAVSVVSRRDEHVTDLRKALGSAASVLTAGTGDPDLSDASVVIVARASGEHLSVARQAVSSGRHVISTSDDPREVRGLLELDGAARSAGLTVIAGAAMSPGLSCLLARHAATLLDEVDEIHVARDGVAGPACARQRLRALRGSATEWRDGAWVRRGGFSGRELCWFPDPIGGRDCYRADLAEPLVLVDAFPTLTRCTARLAASRRDRLLVPVPILVGPPKEGGPGAVRVEVRGRIGDERTALVYGVLDHPAVAAAALAAVVAQWVGSGHAPAGAMGVAGLGDPLPVLRELARRGVRAAVFDGVAQRPVDTDQP